MKIVPAIQMYRLCLLCMVNNMKHQFNSLIHPSYQSFCSKWYFFGLAGLFGSKQNWRSISKALHTKTTRKVWNYTIFRFFIENITSLWEKYSVVLQVIAIDARNHGESPHSLEHRYVDLAEDINHFYKEHKIDKAVVIGHSMGGRAMMAFAMKYVWHFPY